MGTDSSSLSGSISGSAPSVSSGAPPNRLNMARADGVSRSERAAVVSSREEVLRHILFSHSVLALGSDSVGS